MSESIDLTKAKSTVVISGTVNQGVTKVTVGGIEATHFTITGNILRLGKTCLSCGASSDPYGNLPCGH
nr:hypothetical protein HUO10_003301 [Paraburkholderia busanensis]